MTLLTSAAATTVLAHLVCACASTAEPSPEVEAPPSATSGASSSAPSSRAPDRDRTPEPPVTYPTGPAPRIGLLVDSAYVPPDGEPSYPLPRLPRGADIVAATRLEDGLVVSDNRYFEGTNGLFLSTVDGVTAITPCTSGSGATNSDQTLAAWATFACPESGVATPATVHLRGADGTIRTQMVAAPNINALISAAGVLGDEVIVNRAFGSGAFVTDLDQAPRDLVGVASVAAVNEARGTIAAELSTFGWGVLDPTGAEPLFRSPQGSGLDEFSPDGDTVVARGLRRSNCATIWFLDAESGQERGTVTPGPGASSRSCGRTTPTCWLSSPRRGRPPLSSASASTATLNRPDRTTRPRPRSCSEADRARRF
ncbi:hypothetical protein JOE61_003748 [Nocardioides salarius]|uniref:Phytase-like domain-containing protein n=1 Tax=Nocardioides salarius TaxID=374513 RepID=A0ABS2MFG7_9ACTN|nr:hypothetical protein [Nocardioides salarius]MBM7509934.1 hypothetical protein [Nocardioides salarius]